MDSDAYIPFKVRVSQVVGLAKLILSKAEIETLIAKSVTAAEAKLEALIVKKAEIETLIAKSVTASEAKLEALIVKKAEIETLIAKSVTASEAKLEALIVKKAEIETLITKSVTAAEINVEKLIVKKVEIEALIAKALRLPVSLEENAEVGHTVEWLDGEKLKAWLTTIKSVTEAGKKTVYVWWARAESAVAEGNTATLSVNGQASTGEGDFEKGEIRAEINGPGGQKKVSLITGLGKSSFLQLAALANWRISFGKAETSFAAQQLKTIEFKHSLGKTPSFVFCTMDKGSSDCVASGGPEGTEFLRVVIQQIHNASITRNPVTLYWLVIG